MNYSSLRFVGVLVALLVSAHAFAAPDTAVYERIAKQVQQADPNRVEMQEALMSAVIRGEVGQVQSLLREGVDPNFSLNNASHAKVDPRFSHPRGATPLMVAAAQKYQQNTEALLQRGAKVNVQLQGKGKTPLMFAAQKDRYSNIDLLLQAGAKADVTDETNVKWTALMYAARQGNVTSVVHLLREVTPENLRTPLNRTNPPMTRAELTKEYFVNLGDANGATALYLAVIKEGNVNVIRNLLQAGADPLRTANGTGRSPLSLAASYNEEEYLREMSKYLTPQQKEMPEVKDILDMLEK